MDRVYVSLVRLGLDTRLGNTLTRKMAAAQRALRLIGRLVGLDRGKCTATLNIC